MTEREELEKIAREQAALERKRVEAFESLVVHPGWKFFVDVLNERIGDLTKNLFSRPEKDANARGEDYDKGACYHLLWARDLPPTIIDAAKNAASGPATEENES